MALLGFHLGQVTDGLLESLCWINVFMRINLNLWHQFRSLIPKTRFVLFVIIVKVFLLNLTALDAPLFLVIGPIGALVGLAYGVFMPAN
jgi:hypothetical protein